MHGAILAKVKAKKVKCVMKFGRGANEIDNLSKSSLSLFFGRRKDDYKVKLFRDYFKGRTVLGFFLPFSGALLSLFSGFFYLGFLSSRYYSPLVALFSVLAGAIFLLISLFPIISRWASIPLFALSFVALLWLIKDGYLYFSEAFYGGFSLSALFKMDPFFLYPMLGIVLAMALSEFGLYALDRKKQPKPQAKEAN